MPPRLLPLAIAYDFDGTLAPGNMQEHLFLPKVGVKKKEFWEEVSQTSKSQQADNILVYMGLMLKKAYLADVEVQKKDFREYGRGSVSYTHLRAHETVLDLVCRLL